MTVRVWFALLILRLLPGPSASAGIGVTPEAQQVKEEWLRGVVARPAADPAGAPAIPFSFTYGGQPSAQLLPGWHRDDVDARVDEHRAAHTVTWTDPATGLLVRWVVVGYDDYPVVEWTLSFRNTGLKTAPILSDVQAINTRFQRRADGEFTLHAFAGSTSEASDYAPRLMPLGPRATATLRSTGYSTQEDLPYFNLDWGGAGAIVAIGWPGGWTAHLARDEDQGLQLRGGMTRLSVALKAGEEIRSPLVALLFWKGDDWIRSQNVWRHWMLDHNIPRPGGKLPRPFTATCVDGMFPGMQSNAKDEIAALENYRNHDSPLDYWWVDAGWYPCEPEWANTGTWEPDPKRYPHGLKQVSDAVHTQGMKLVVWFEPERVRAGTWLAENHPEWILGGKGGGLLNLGNPDAWKWVVEHFDNLIVTQGVDLYRQDFNMNPGDAWASADTADRIGMTELRHVEGYLAYWDELRRRHPDLLLDTCASGGRRNDLETLRRAVPLLRSDYRFEPNGTQGHNYGISFWMPFNGTGVEPADPYVMRSHFCACFAYGGPCNDPNFDFAGRNRIAREWRSVADAILLGDYYPLTDYSLSPAVWMAWQFDQVDAGRGVIQVFRRAESPTESATLKLRGLDPAASYVLRDFDQEGVKTVTGRELTETGLVVRLSRRASAATIAYRRAE